MQKSAKLDSRWLFQGYATLTAIAGFAIAGWGPMWFGADLGGQPWAKAVAIRIFGGMLMAGACASQAIAAVEDPEVRRKAAGWFALGHAIIAGIVLLQANAIPESVASMSAANLLIAATLLFY